MSKALKKQGTHSDRLQVLVEKVTTSGFNAPDDVLVCEIIDLCCISSATVSDLFRLATVQLLRKHAQIRLGVLRLLRMLSSPREIFEKVNYSVDDSAKFIHVAKYLRNLILDHLQDTFSNILQLESGSPPLPPPKEAAERLQTEAVELLLDWEYEIDHGYYDITPWNPSVASTSLPWIPSQREKGQLKAFLNFLNLDSAMVGASGSGHRPARELIRKVREKRQQKVRLFKNEANKSRRLLTKCLNEIKEFSELIEENLTSLSTLLDILVPNQLDENNKGNKNETRSEVQKIGSEYPFSSTKVESTKSVNSLDSLRLHGFLSGSSSGMGLGSTLTIEIHLPCNSQTDSSGFPFGPKILIKRSEETRDIEESAKTYARLADEKHKPKLINWLQTLESIQTVDSSGNLSLKRSEKIKQIQQWIDRVETLTTLFHRGIEFFDNVPENNGNIFVQSSDLQQHDDMFVSSDESDFEDVDGTVHNTVELLCPDKSSPENAIGLRREKSELTAQKNLTNIEDTKAQNLTQKENDRLKLQKTGQVVDNLQSTSSHKSAVSEVKSSHHTVVWRSTESAHRFWKPTDPDEYDTPQEYLESAISFVSKDASQYEVSTAQNHSPIHRTETEQDGIGLPDGVPDVPIGLICWAPLLSGSLCQRHSTSGRCPVHGRIVKRDRATGRPVNIEDRKIIQQEMESTRLTKQKKLDEKRKKDSRKHYPGLMNLSKKATDSHGRLQARVMNKRSLQKLSETLMK